MEAEKSTISHLQAVGLGLPVTWLVHIHRHREPVWPPVQDLEFRDQKVLMLRSGVQEHQRKRLAWVPFFVALTEGRSPSTQTCVPSSLETVTDIPHAVLCQVSSQGSLMLLSTVLPQSEFHWASS